MADSTSIATDYRRLIRPAIHHASAYVPASFAEPDEPGTRQIRLNWNESPYGPSPKTAQALATFHLTNRYPDITQSRLRAALAAYAGVPEARVVPAAGMDDVITNLYAALLDDGDELIITEPTFGVYRHAAELRGARVVNVPLGPRPDFAIDIDGIIAAVTPRTKAVMVCNPGNPTANLNDPDGIARLARALDCLIVVDEAYAEFSGQTQLPLMDRHENVCVLRTLSKWAGLAGMRVGYGIFPDWLAPAIWAVAPAFCNISTAGEAAAIASLEDVDYLQGLVRQMVDDREALIRRLAAIPGVRPYPSATNFVLMSLPMDDAEPVFNRLAAESVLVRFFGDQTHGLRDCLRTSIGTDEENILFADALERILREMRA